MPTFNALNTAMWKGQILTGANSATPIAVADITTEDTILIAVYEASGGALTSVITSEASIPVDGYVQFSTTSTASGKVLLVWLDKDAAEA